MLTRKKNQDIMFSIGKLQAANRELEATDIFRDWKFYESMPLAQQQQIKQAWYQYYREVRESVIYAMVMEQRKALLGHDLQRVKEIAGQVLQMEIDGQFPQVQKPAFRDPMEFSFSEILNSLKKNKEQIKGLTRTPDVVIEMAPDI